MKFIERDPNFLISFNPAFLIIKDEEEYVLYNSISHVVFRLSKLEFKVLDLYYTYRDNQYIISQFPDHENVIRKSLDFITNNNIIETDGDAYDSNRESFSIIAPASYYIHLTYLCNLHCSYCYNQDIRKLNKKELSWREWKLIFDKIIPFANGVIFTGGECFLSPNLEKSIRYFRCKKESINLSCISNGMHDFSQHKFDYILGHINRIKLSCDSLTDEGERKGFIPELFINNIKYIRDNYPDLTIDVAPTISFLNVSEINKFEFFCKSYNCNLDQVFLLPQHPSEIELCADLEDQLSLSKHYRKYKVETQNMHYKRERCKAGKAVCSIDNKGNVYPCQSLHYEEFIMGNLLNQSVEDLKYIGEKISPIPSVDDIIECGKCKVKYICGGGCLANGYNLYKYLRNNHLVCPTNFENAITKILTIKTRTDL